MSTERYEGPLGARIEVIEVTDGSVVIESLLTGKKWGVAVNILEGGEEAVVTELEPESSDGPH